MFSKVCVSIRRQQVAGGLQLELESRWLSRSMLRLLDLDLLCDYVTRVLLSQW